MSLEMVQAGLGLVSGLGGLFGKKKSKAQQMLEADSAKDRKIRSGLLDEALKYDSGAANTATIEELQARSQNAFEQANRNSWGEAAKGGVNMGGDTAFAVNRQRSINSITDPLRMQIAQMRAGEAQQNLAYKMNALSSLGPMSNSVIQSPERDNSGSYMQIAGGLDGIMGGLQRKAKVSGMRKQAKSGAKSIAEAFG